jgi:hypothetical protein
MNKVTIENKSIYIKALNLVASKKFRYFIYCWFVLQIVYMAISTNTGIPPDEGTHMRTIELYSRDGIDPFIQNQPEEAYQLGAVSRSPSYMYHYIMSFPYRLIPDSFGALQQTIIMRLFNLIFSVTGLLVFSKVLLLLKTKDLVHNLTLFMVANTLMLVFLSSSVNYDNLVFLCVNVVFYYFIKVLKTPDLADVLKLVAIMLFASLVKFTFLPLGALLVGVLVFNYRQNLPGTFKKLKKSKKLVNQKTLLILTTACLLLLVLFFERYGLNYIRYGTYKPQCDQVNTYDQCLSSALFRRNLEFRDNLAEDKVPGVSFTLRWLERNKEGIFGILGHKFADETSFVRYSSFAILSIMSVAIIYKLKTGLKEINYLLAIAVAYTIILLLFNYSLFQKSGRFGLALQGRYVFPVIGLFYLAGNYYIDKIFETKRRLYAFWAVILIMIFLLSSLPGYIYTTNSTWWTDYTKDINIFIKLAIRKLVP